MRPLLKRKRGEGENVKRKNDHVMIRKGTKRGRDVVAPLLPAVTVTTTTTRTSTTGVKDTAEQGVVAKAYHNV